ncbi:DNA-binding SARP family transcriptional activator [Kibdelosporangium banguiense]|uniref:DNA-binding SARP family transcriptional activator n=1 Tax=Kibdelosporangium banguiense TaxID=1365924 RepID=A0ABS4T7I8_9PSEU|nr:AfsR/SARP family transcriptional regulator [Kibdelosporangium banguiense]MBP2320256.1 DNA-binding SARP family transcriptional activator [Kibdelosporangium banguiense]
MRIQLLGPLSVSVPGRRGDVGSRKVRTVLARLALSPGVPVPCEQLVHELWGDKPMGNARNALQANIARLRKILGGPDLVRTLGNGYLLDVPPQAIDVHRFGYLADQGSARVERAPKEAVHLLEAALRLWRGPALCDVLDGAWCRAEAGRLDERRLIAREDLIAARLANAEDRGVLSELKQLVTEHPERERLSEQLMLALYRSGRQSEALNVFHYTRTRLGKELGLQPSRALRSLYQAILVQDVVLG